MQQESHPEPGQLHEGDCVDGLKAIANCSVDLAFADPPFNIGYEYDVYHDARKADEYLAWTRQWGEQVVRVLKPDGTFWLAIGDEFAAELKVLFNRELGLNFRSWVIWYYTFGVNCSKKFTRSHAHLLYFTKDEKAFTFHDDAIRVPSARQLIYADKRANPRGRLPDDTWIANPDHWITRPQDVADTLTADKDTWLVSRVCGTFNERKGWHGCQMPEKILGRIIRACSSPRELVLDPFAGSGTTLAVAKKLDRRYLGYELSPSYAANVRHRLDAIEVGQELEGGELAKDDIADRDRKQETRKRRPRWNDTDRFAFPD